MQRLEQPEYRLREWLRLTPSIPARHISFAFWHQMEGDKCNQKHLQLNIKRPSMCRKTYQHIVIGNQPICGEIASLKEILKQTDVNEQTEQSGSFPLVKAEHSGTNRQRQIGRVQSFQAMQNMRYYVNFAIRKLDHSATKRNNC